MIIVWAEVLVLTRAAKSQTYYRHIFQSWVASNKNTFINSWRKLLASNPGSGVAGKFTLTHPHV